MDDVEELEVECEEEVGDGWRSSRAIGPESWEASILSAERSDFL
jgi:hypothetical protein